MRLSQTNIFCNVLLNSQLVLQVIQSITTIRKLDARKVLLLNKLIAKNFGVTLIKVLQLLIICQSNWCNSYLGVTLIQQRRVYSIPL